MKKDKRAIPPRIPEGEAIEDQEEMSMEELNFQFKKRIREYKHFVKFILNDLDLKDHAKVLEIGPGPAWISIVLVKENPTIRLTGLELSNDMIRIATQNVKNEMLGDKIKFIQGNAQNMHFFPDNSFDAVISHDSLHHWEDPKKIFNETARVLKHGGVFCIADGRRDIRFGAKLIFIIAKLFISKVMSYYWKSSINAGYTPEEIVEILNQTDLKNNYKIQADIFDIIIHNL